jgi:hypothetical protein
MSNKNPKSAQPISTTQGWNTRKILAYMHDMTLPVNHNVPVVAILDLENVASHGVGSHGLDEVQPRLLEGNGVWCAILRNKERHQIVDLCATHLITRGGVRNDVDDTALQDIMSMDRQRSER